MRSSGNLLYERLISHSVGFHPVLDFDPDKDKIISIDLTKKNDDLGSFDPTDTDSFSKYISAVLKKNNARYGIGGYHELRELYSRSDLFTGRRMHLGIDIWGEAGSKVYAPFGGLVHSFAYNNNFGDYGATIILQHQLDGIPFYTLYGHVSLGDLARVREGDFIIRGDEFAHFGKPEENGNWPPHLHFQIINEIHFYKGDYPGVCRSSEQKDWLANSPDPDAILNLLRYTK